MTDENTQNFLNRFTQAVEQLRSKKPETQLRGINALEQIANDAPDWYYTTVMEVLTTYVRENAPRLPEESPSPTSASSEDNEGTAEHEKQEPLEKPPPADIQAIMTVATISLAY